MAKLTSGTIKIKNIKGELDIFYPHILTSQVFHHNKQETIYTSLEQIDKKINIINSDFYGDIKIVKDIPTNENTNDEKNETMFIYFPYPETFKFTTNNPVVSIPFDMYGTENCSFEVNWGDGTIETFVSSDFIRDITIADDFDYYEDFSYQKNGSSYSISTVTPASHLYEDGIDTHTITVTSKHFDRMYWLSLGTEAFIENVLTPIPTVKGVIYFMSNYSNENEWITTYVKKDNSLEYAFSYNTIYHVANRTLNSIPSNLFSYNTNITSVCGAFNGCKLLETIPESLFSECNNIKDFSNCFKDCSAITEIPTGLFADCINAENFNKCFYECSQLTELPGNLFSNCVNAKDFSECFYGANFNTISQDLFANCINAENFNYCFMFTNITYIPEGLFDDCVNAVSMDGCFSLSDAVLIPEGLFDNCTKLKTLEYCFQNCKITSIPEGLFKYNNNITNFSYCFNGCTLLNDFTLYIYSKNVNFAMGFVSQKNGTERIIYVLEDTKTYDSFTEANYNFGDSLGLTINPCDWWSYDVMVTDTSNTVTSTSIPFNMYGISNDIELYVDWGDGTSSIFTSDDYLNSNILENTSNNTQFIHRYEGIGLTAKTYTITMVCSDFSLISLYTSSYVSSNSPLYYFKHSLEKINTKLPQLNVNSFDYCFSGCSWLLSVPSDLFRYNTDATTFNYCFRDCTSLTSIPTDLFRYNTAVTNFSNCFYHCTSLTSIPTDLFKYNTLVEDFSGCFSECIKLTTIPQDLFKYNTAVTSFNCCFASISYSDNLMHLQSIPAHLFDNCINVVDFSCCFWGCTLLTSIPTDLFRYNTLVEDFSGCFAYCISLTSIPTDLFRYNTKALYFHHCFEYCTSLTTIPQDLFRYNTLSIDIEGCFEHCSSLTSIPEDLFRYNTVITSFNYCFSDCNSLTDVTLHIGSENVEECWGFIYPVKENVTRIIYVPNNSLSQTTFNAQSEELNLTIIGE